MAEKLTDEEIERRKAEGQSRKVAEAAEKADRQRHQAAEIVRVVLADLGIGRVVFVDDQLEFQAEVALADMSAALDSERVNMAELTALFPGMETDEADVGTAGELAVGLLHSRWAVLTPTQQEEGYVRYREHQDQPEGSREGTRIERLLDLFQAAGAGDVVTLTPADWDTRRAELVDDARLDQSRVLFIFDNDLGRGESRRSEGMEIVRGMAADLSKGVFILVSHKFQQQNEDEETAALRKGLPPESRILAVAKAHLDANPILFARRVRAVALFDTMTDLLKRVEVAFEGSVARVCEEVLALAPTALEHVLINSPSRLNITEPDVVARLVHSDLRYQVERRMREDPEIARLAARIRSATSLEGVELEDKSVLAQFALFKRRENYIEREHLMALRLPLGAGDIFRELPLGSAKAARRWSAAVDGERYFVLVEQDCDLEVRADGNRSPDMAWMRLLPVVHGKPKGAYVEFPSFCPETFAPWSADLRNIVAVPSIALDLCAVSSDGAAIADLAASPPDELTKYWAARYDNQIRSSVNDICVRHKRLSKGLGSPQAKRQVLKALLPPASPVVEARIARDTLEFNLQRVSRVRHPRYLHLLQQLAQQMQRIPFDEDVAPP
jgi:hypothetical protein